MILINNSKNKIKRGSITYNRASDNGIYIENYIIEGEIKGKKKIYKQDSIRRRNVALAYNTKIDDVLMALIDCYATF